jgi:erythronate-4-phosphate dehydrogenase
MKIIADENIPFVKECFGSIGDVTVMPGRDITAENTCDCDVLLVRSITAVNAQLLTKSNVRFVGTATIGTDHIDKDYLVERNIALASASGSNANSVAEYVIAALLSVANKHKITLEGKSIGIIGVGNIGSRVEEKVTALGMKPFLNDPPLQRKTSDPGYLPIKELLDCDFITLHTPLSFEGIDKTYHLADEAFFKSLKPGCIFLNTARGAVHDTTALKAAIKSAHLKATVLDVWENEPDIDDELLRLVDISTPHIAGYSFDGKVAGMMMLCNAVCRHFDLQARKTIADFLPSPEAAEIEITGDITDSQRIICQTVQQVYAINTDDFNMREILMVPKEKRAAFFDELRKNYPIRREFRNTKIKLAAKGIAAKTLAGKLTGLGFEVE